MKKTVAVVTLALLATACHGRAKPAAAVQAQSPGSAAAAPSSQKAVEKFAPEFNLSGRYQIKLPGEEDGRDNYIHATELGAGFDSKTQTALARCFNGDVEAQLLDAPEVHFRLERVTNGDEIELRVSAIAIKQIDRLGSAKAIAGVTACGDRTVTTIARGGRLLMTATYRGASAEHAAFAGIASEIETSNTPGGTAAFAKALDENQKILASSFYTDLGGGVALSDPREAEGMMDLFGAKLSMETLQKYVSDFAATTTFTSVQPEQLVYTVSRQ